jgi:putative sugar O-methyltransferase
MEKSNQKNVLSEMLEDMKKIPKIYQPSDFWIDLNTDHLGHLSKSGFKNFKRSISGKYFSWGIMGLLAHQLFPMLTKLSSNSFKKILNSGFENYSLKINERVRRYDPLTAFIYKTYVVLLYDYVSKIDKRRILVKIEEPLIGNPFIIRYSNKNISQDLSNSTHEFYSIMDNVQTKKISNIVELGAGYGRLAYIFLKELPNVKYTIIDIPPALYVAQEYLSKVFPKVKIFKYRQFNDFKKVRREFESAKIRFLMANQIELIPDKYFELTINISSIHEMTKQQIKHYLKQIDRITKGYFYTKQWRRSRTNVNSNITRDQYPIPRKWKLIVGRDRHPIQKWFFDELYKID